MDTTPHAGERGGGVGVEMALIWIAMLGLVAAATQVALVFYAGQLALTAAQDGVHAGATQTAAAQDPVPRPALRWTPRPRAGPMTPPVMRHRASWPGRRARCSPPPR